MEPYLLEDGELKEIINTHDRMNQSELKSATKTGISQEDSMKELAELAYTADLDVKEIFLYLMSFA